MWWETFQVGRSSPAPGSGRNRVARTCPRGRCCVPGDGIFGLFSVKAGPRLLAGAYPITTRMKTRLETVVSERFCRDVSGPWREVRDDVWGENSSEEYPCVGRCNRWRSTSRNSSSSWPNRKCRRTTMPPSAFQSPELIDTFTALERHLASPEGGTLVSEPICNAPRRRQA